MLPPNRRARAENKNADLQPKTLPGYVRAEMVKCGKARCKCARGELHGPYFYHFTWRNNRRAKSYIKRADVAAVKKACAAHRSLQRRLRADREQFRAFMCEARELLKLLNEVRGQELL